MDFPSKILATNHSSKALNKYVGVSKNSYTATFVDFCMLKTALQKPFTCRICCNDAVSGIKNLNGSLHCEF